MLFKKINIGIIFFFLYLILFSVFLFRKGIIIPGDFPAQLNQLDVLNKIFLWRDLGSMNSLEDVTRLPFLLLS
jgi:hypothetical protein